MRRIAFRLAAVAAVAASWAGTAVTSTASSSAPLVVHHPRLSLGVRNAGWAASNWSGYAVGGSGFTAVTGQWRIPAVTGARHGAAYSSNWIGIDGFTNSSLIQTGTESDFYNGSGHYGAWWEILPNPATFVSLAVNKGDLMSASISRGAGGTWTISLTDVTTGQNFTNHPAYNGPLTSAEWIEEAPTVGGRIANLANYGTATFDPGTVNGGSPNLTAADSGVMIQHGVQVSTPSNPDKEADGFSMNYGSTAPNPPGS